VALPNAVSVAVMTVWGRSSDARRERIWHVAIPVTVASASFFMASLTGSDPVMYLALGVTQVMCWSAIAPLISMPSSFLGGSAAAGGLALVVSIGQIGSFIGSTLIGVLRERTGGFAAPMAVIGIFLAVAAAVTLLLGRALASRARAAHSSR
jgi:ACS family tartrate transporter-like MFS transporter